MGIHAAAQSSTQSPYWLRSRKRAHSELLGAREEQLGTQSKTDLLELSSEQPKPITLDVPVVPFSAPDMPFQVLRSTKPSILGQATSLPSPGFLDQLVHALEQVPLRLREAVSDWGYKIVAAHKSADVLPPKPSRMNAADFINIPIDKATYDRITYANSSGHWWQTHTSRSAWYPKTILLPERGQCCVGFMRQGDQQVPVRSSKMKGPVVVEQFMYEERRCIDPALAQLHELGHSVDDYLGAPRESGGHGFLSSSEGFSQAYWADVRDITRPEAQEELAYYLPRMDNPTDRNGEAKSEAFAEIFARLFAPSGNPEVHAQYQLAFPRVCAFIKRMVIAPWMTEEELKKPAPPQERIAQDYLCQRLSEQLLLTENVSAPDLPGSFDNADLV